jgi:four helix bundle protein
MAEDFFYKKVEAYKKGKELTKQVYYLLRKFPSYEIYILSDQIRRAAISIPSNIAEGMGRMSVKERIHFLEIAYGSLTEVTCQMDIAESLGYITEEELRDIEERATEVGRIMSGLRKSLIQKIQ